MAQKPDSSKEWKGPSVKEMIETHTLAENIIKYHNEPCPVFDAENLVALREFVSSPSAADQFLRNRDMADAENPEFVGQGAVSKGSLVGYIAARHRLSGGATDSRGGSLMTDAEIEELKKWFDSGAADERMKGASAISV